MGIRRKETYDGNGNLLFVQNEEFDDAAEASKRKDLADSEIDRNPAIKAIVKLLAQDRGVSEKAMRDQIKSKVD